MESHNGDNGDSSKGQRENTTQGARTDVGEKSLTQEARRDYDIDKKTNMGHLIIKGEYRKLARTQFTMRGQRVHLNRARRRRLKVGGGNCHHISRGALQRLCIMEGRR